MFRLATIGLIAAGVFATQISGPNLGVLDGSQPITYLIEDGAQVPGYRSSDRDLAKMALDAWARESGGKLKFVEIKDKQDPMVRLRWISPNQGLFGEMERIEVKGKPGAIVNVTAQVDQLGEPLATRAIKDSLLRDTIVYLTCVHELGHAVGLPHTRNYQDIMYFLGYGGDIVEYFMRYRNKIQSRADIAKHSGLSGGDADFLRNLYK